MAGGEQEEAARVAAVESGPPGLGAKPCPHHSP